MTVFKCRVKPYIKLPLPNSRQHKLLKFQPIPKRHENDNSACWPAITRYLSNAFQTRTWKQFNSNLYEELKRVFL